MRTLIFPKLSLSVTKNHTIYSATRSNSLLDVFLNNLSTGLTVNQVSTEQMARSLFGFNPSLGIVGVNLFFRQVGDGDIGSFAGH